MYILVHVYIYIYMCAYPCNQPPRLREAPASSAFGLDAPTPTELPESAGAGVVEDEPEAAEPEAAEVEEATLDEEAASALEAFFGSCFHCRGPNCYRYSSFMLLEIITHMCMCACMYVCMQISLSDVGDLGPGIIVYHLMYEDPLGILMGRALIRGSSPRSFHKPPWSRDRVPA